MSQTKITKDVLTNAIDTPNITDGAVTESKINPSVFTNITGSQLSSTLDLSSKTLTFSTPQLSPQIPTVGQDENAFNIGLLGFKMAVSEGLTIFNLVDGVVDEFNDETGVDTPENSNATYDSTSDFYSNQTGGAYPGSPYIVSDFTSPGTYTAPATASAINLLVVGGGGGGGGSDPNHSGGGGGAGGLIYLNDLPVTGGGTYAITIGEGGEGGEAVNSSASQGEDGDDTTFVYSPSVSIIGEGGGGAHFSAAHGVRPGGSGGGNSNSPGDPSSPSFATEGGLGLQSTNHPVTGLSDFEGTSYTNSPPSFSSEGSEQVGSFGNSVTTPQINGSGGGGAGSTNQNSGHPQGLGASGGEGLDYNILDGSTAVAFSGGGAAGGLPAAQPSIEGGEGDEGGRSGGDPNGLATTNSGGGGGGTYTSTGKPGADGRVIVALSRTLTTNTSMTLISDTFTANSTPTKARIEVFAELADDLNTDIIASVTRDNSTFNSVTLTDEGFEAGASGIKIFTGSTPLTGSGSPQVALRWKIVGSSLTGNNKVHGVALQWA